MEMAKKLTIDEFLELGDREDWMRWELIDGVVMMSPAPTRLHQIAERNLAIKIGTALENTPCYPLWNTEVRYAQNNYFIPDMNVYCGDDELVPKITIEILSPSTQYIDLGIKRAKYEAIGIWEYWLIDTKLKIVTVHDFKNEETTIYTAGETISSKNIPEITIIVDDIFKLWNE